MKIEEEIKQLIELLKEYEAKCDKIKQRLRVLVQ